MSTEQEKQVGIFSKIRKFFSDQRGEMKKISWPGKKQVINNTAIVIGVMVTAAVVVGAFDSVLSMLMSLFLQA